MLLSVPYALSSSGVWYLASGVLPFPKGHDGRTLVFEDGLIRMDANIELISELARLHDGSSMTYLVFKLSI